MRHSRLALITIMFAAMISPLVISSSGGEDSLPEQRQVETNVFSEPEQDSRDVVALSEKGQISLRTSSGEFKWTVYLEGRIGSVRPPHFLNDADRVYIAHNDGVTALSAKDGTVLWHSPGPSDRMLLSGKLILATECTSDRYLKERWVVARSVETGREVFRVGLPVEDFDPLPITEATGLFVVQKMDEMDGKGFAIFIDRNGKEFFRNDREVIALQSFGDARLVLTAGEVFRLSNAGVVEWSISFSNREWIAGGDMLSLPGDDMVAFHYCQIADTGVQLLRFDPIHGGKVWETSCAGLGVAHSAYRHSAKVEMSDDLLKVISHGSGGEFTEILDPETGKSVHRDTSRP